MIELDLQVLWCTDEMWDKQNMNMEYDIEDSDLKPHTFYHISHIRPYDEEKCTVISDGCVYIMNESYEVVKQKIHDQRVFKFN